MSYYILNFEEPSNHTRPPLNSTGATLLNILGVVGGNDIFTSLGMVHHGRMMREKAIEDPIEDAGSNEGVDIANSETIRFELLA